jgi:hypothetical protein
VTSFRTVWILLLCIGTVLGPLPSKSDETKTLVIMIDHSPTGFVYLVDKHPASADFLTFLNKHLSEWPQEKTKVVLLAHEQVTVAQINNTRGMIIKAGYEPPRVFYYGSDHRAMVELTFSPAVPFSQGGPTEITR